MSFFDNLFRGMKEHTARRRFSREALMKMDDATLISEVGMMVEKKCDDGIKLTEPEIVAFTLWLLDMEVQNGGLDQFFFNSSRAFAPCVPAALMSVDASEYEALLAHFLDETGINLSALPEDTDAFKDAFEEFDSAYYALYESKPLEALTAKYIRDHLDVFAE